MVVLLHADLFVAPLIDHHQSLLIKKWYLMVDLFFVLSGFVIAHVYGPIFENSVRWCDYRRFLVARFARLYPLHLLTLLWSFAAFGGLMWFKHPMPYEVRKFFEWPGFFSNLVFAQAIGLHDTWRGNGPAWSVSSEWWTYLLFPLLASKGTARGKWGIAAALLFVAAAYFIIENWLTVNCPLFADDRLAYMRGTLGTTFDFGWLRCLAGFVLGMVMYRAYVTNFARHLLSSTSSFALLIIATAIGMHCNVNDVVTALLFAFIVLAAAFNRSSLSRWCSTRLLQRLGDWSYSIYLIHFPLLCSLMVLVDAINGPPRKEASLPPPVRPLLAAWGIAIFWCLLTIGVAAIVHRYIEVPARQRIRRWGERET